MDEPAAKPWWQYVLDWLGWLWHRLTDPLGRAIGNAAVSHAIGIAVLVVVLALLAFVIARFAMRVRVRRAAARPVAAAATLDAEADARTLWSRALAAAAAGRHHEAAALFWGSALRALDEHGRVRYDAALTPGEWRRAVRDPAFDALARDAVVALFGDEDPDAALVARMSASYDRLVGPA